MAGFVEMAKGSGREERDGERGTFGLVDCHFPREFRAFLGVFRADQVFGTFWIAVGISNG
jgi:hypothetical protein